MRTVAIPERVMVPLAFHLEHRDASEGPDALLLVHPLGGSVRAKTFHRARARARVAVGRTDLHFHDLRHTSNTWAAATGVSTRRLMARMGHESHVAVLRYQHVTANADVPLRTVRDELN